MIQSCKKTVAVEAIVSELGLANVDVVTGRAEEISGIAGFKNSFDMVIARAVAALPELARWARGLLKAGSGVDSFDSKRKGRIPLPEGVLLALKGGDLEREIQQARLRLQVSGVELIPLVFDGRDQLGLEDKSIVVVTFR